jgi:hypothetical protein
MAAGHLLFITPTVLRGMLGRAGFRVERASVFSFRDALKALGMLPVRRRQVEAPVVGTDAKASLDTWEPPPPQQGLRGTMLYARFREWRSRHPALPAWLPLGFRQRVIGRKA